MKKLLVVLLVAGTVLLIIFLTAKLTLADDDILSAVKRGTLTYKEYHRVISDPIIPMGSKRDIVRVDIEEAELPLYEGTYWIFDGEKKIRVSTKGLIFWPLPRGVYVLYTAP